MNTKDSLDPAALLEIAAAERTIAILKERVVVLQGGSQSSIQRQLEAARRRDEENRRRRELMEVRAAELARHSETLEREVARRTLAMRRILDNVKFGFLVVDRDLIVQPECTVSCRELLGAERVEGASLIDLLRLTSRQASGYRLCVDQVFEDLLPEEVAFAQTPTNFQIGHRTVRAEGSVVRGADGRVENVLYTIGDVTELLAAQHESAENRTLIGILKNLESFRSFLGDTRELLARARAALAAAEERELRRMVHTIKGNSASYDLFDIVRTIHVIEEGPIDAASLDRIARAFTSFLEQHRAVLGLTFWEGRGPTFEVSTDQVSELQGLAAELRSPELDAWTAAVTERAASVLLGPVQVFGERLAERLGKRVELSITGGDTPLDVAKMRPVVQTIVHLVRNAIDHGIEEPGERGTKPEAGRVHVSIARDSATYYIIVEDDGSGIDTERVCESAVRSGKADASRIAAMSVDEKHALIFVDGVSSTETANEISGRGLGMSAVMAATCAAGGSISVTSRRGRGVTFAIAVPRSSEEKPRSRPSVAA